MEEALSVAPDSGPHPESDSPLEPEDRTSIRILVVDDDQSVLDSCESVLTGQGYRVDTVRKGEEAVRVLRARDYQLLLVDQNMPGMSGLEVVEAMHEHSAQTVAIVMTGYATTGASLEATRAGAWNYLPKPFTATQLLVLVGRAAVRVQRRRRLGQQGDEAPDGNVVYEGETPILGRSRAIRDVIARALKVAPTDASVFITGESGTGKELVARCIHQASRRSKKSFVVVNCAALPGELLESEIFGHRRGAFTGAVRDKPGLIETADRGTFFLDELCELPITLQPKLLRVLQDGVVRRVGSESDDAQVDVRLISATNRDPERALEDGSLREDLFYRLRVIPIHLPPLRERREDVPVLARHYVDHFWRRHQLPGDDPPEITPAALEMLRSYDWPGNVRQLRNVVEQLVVLADPDRPIGPEALAAVDQPASAGSDGAKPWGNGGLGAIDYDREYHDAKQELIDRFEQSYVAQVVSRAGGNMSEAARRAGIDRTTLYRLLDKHDLSKEEIRG